jgi:hypothetical protein
LFGDCGQGTPSDNAIAHQTYLAKPDFIFIPGDIVYGSGRITEYLRSSSPTTALRSLTKQRRAGVAVRTVYRRARQSRYGPEQLPALPRRNGLLLLLDRPLNDPMPLAGAPKTTHTLTGTIGKQEFLAAAGPRYSRMANFSFDYGNSHWTVLDANT